MTEPVDARQRLPLAAMPTERTFDFEPISGKALALIGMRRVGKTYLCYQAIQRLLGEGVPQALGLVLLGSCKQLLINDDTLSRWWCL